MKTRRNARAALPGARIKHAVLNRRAIKAGRSGQDEKAAHLYDQVRRSRKGHALLRSQAGLKAKPLETKY